MAFPLIFTQLPQYVRAAIACIRARLQVTKPLALYRIHNFRVLPIEGVIPPDEGEVSIGALVFIPLPSSEYCIIVSVPGENELMIKSETTQVVLSEPELTFCWYDEGAAKLYAAALNNHDDFCALAALCFGKGEMAIWVRGVRFILLTLGHFGMFHPYLSAFVITVIGVCFYLLA